MTNMKKWLDLARKLFDQESTVGTKQVAVYQQEGDGAWKAVTGEVGGDRLVVSSAREVTEAQAENGQTETALVTAADRSLCRSLEVAEAPPDQTRKMVALRLETELPYAVEDSLWACERLPGEEVGRH